MKSILVCAEQRGGSRRKAALEALSEARRVADASGAAAGGRTPAMAPRASPRDLAAPHPLRGGRRGAEVHADEEPGPPERERRPLAAHLGKPGGDGLRVLAAEREEPPVEVAEGAVAPVPAVR